MPTAAPPQARPDTPASAPLDGPEALDAAIDAREAERTAAPERDQAIREALREWAKAHYGSVDPFIVALARRAGVSTAHARNALYVPKSAGVLDEAIALYREARAPEARADSAAA